MSNGPMFIIFGPMGAGKTEALLVKEIFLVNNMETDKAILQLWLLVRNKQQLSR